MAETPYTPTYWDENESLPSPSGLFGKHIEANKDINTQISEAKLFLDFIQKEDQSSYGALASTTTPTPLLIKVPGTHRVRLLTGITPYMQDPFEPEPSQLIGQFLAILQDIDRKEQEAQVIRLPNDILKINNIMAPTPLQFETKLKQKDDNGAGKPWFKQDAVKDNNIPLALVCPLPPYLAYDAFTDDIPAHIIWERIKCADWTTNTSPIFKHACNFLAAVHTQHNLTNPKKGEIDGNYFMERTGPEASAWGIQRSTMIYPSIQNLSNTDNNQRGAPPSSDINALAQAINNSVKSTPTSTQGETDDDDTARYKKYGLCDADLKRILTMCGLAEGQEEMLPLWFEQIAEKNISADGKRTIIKQLFRKNLKYEEHPIPTTPNIMDMVLKKSFGGDGDGTTSTGAMKGLSPYAFAALTADELEEETNYADAIRSSLATTVAEVQQMKNKKAKAPQSFPSLVSILKAFANAIEKLFGPRSPLLLQLVSDVIRPLISLEPVAKKIIEPSTLASILWAIYKQSQHFTMGQMFGNEAISAEWTLMTNNIKGGGQNFRLLSVPIDISGTAMVTIDDDDDKSNKRKEKGNDTNETNEKGKTKKKGKVTVDIHPVIKAKITPSLPDNLSLKKLCQVCNIAKVHHFFPRTNICVFGALKGFCPYNRCPNSHDASKVTDAMAEAVVQMLDPFLRDPSLLTPGQS